ncbi:MAG: SUMF1/EgtB/PvdO family nonheme iron enzyme [bacterium]
MKRMKRMVLSVVAVMVCAAGGMAGAGDLAIQAFDGTGRLTFNEISTATLYRVEWAPTPTGPWTNFMGAVAQLDMIQATGSGIVTCSVPMCYRVVATVTNTSPAVPFGMVAIPAGTNSGPAQDYGPYSLTVEAFYMDATEVTKAMWEEVRTWGATHGYADLPAGSGKASDHPVQTVSWFDCVKWCNARSQKEGKAPCYNLSDWSCNFSANGYRLPTYTEWEYAARGGLSGNRFPWGDIIDHTRANYRGVPADFWYDQGYQGFDTRYVTDGPPYTSPAGAFAANGYGLYDMAGNVWEWCDLSSGSYRYTRGSSWNNTAYYARCRDGFWYDQGYASDDIGFRTVCR